MNVLLVLTGIAMALWLLSLAWNPFSYERDVVKWKKEQEKKKKEKQDE